MQCSEGQVFGNEETTWLAFPGFLKECFSLFPAAKLTHNRTWFSLLGVLAATIPILDQRHDPEYSLEGDCEIKKPEVVNRF